MSFRSLLHLVNGGHCSHFYVCSSSFTALFLKQGIAGSTNISAVLTPTTSGLRNAMEREGELIQLLSINDKIVFSPKAVFTKCIAPYLVYLLFGIIYKVITHLDH